MVLSSENIYFFNIKWVGWRVFVAFKTSSKSALYNPEIKGPTFSFFLFLVSRSKLKWNFHTCVDPPSAAAYMPEIVPT